MKQLASYLVVVVVLLSSCTSQALSSDHVWTIVKLSYDPVTRKAEGGSCGSVFFVSETTFVTAHHGNELNSTILKPNAGYSRVRVFLANTKGDTIDDFWITKRVPEYDLAIGRISRPHSAIRVCPLQTELSVGDDVYNIGFPTDQGVPDYSLRIDGEKLIVQRISMKAFVQKGTVKAIERMSLNSESISLQGKTLAVLDYSSRDGFSGGPLVSRKTGKVVGFMSFVIPKKFDPNTQVVAVRMADIKSIIEEEEDQPEDPGDKQ